MERREKHIRVTVVGDGDTGKTCLLIVYKDRKYEEYYIPTVFDSYSMTVPIYGENYTLILSDTAGQEAYDRLRPLAYPETNVFIICFSVSNWASYENVLHKWSPEVRYHRPTAKVVLVATKCDLRQGLENHIKHEDGERLKKKIKADEYVECSSKFRWNVDEVFSKAMLSAVEKSPRSSSSNRNSKCILL